MGQTSAEAKREVEQTRARLGQTIESLQFRARRNLDVRTQLQENRTVQIVAAGALLAAVGVVLAVLRARRRRSAAERIARRLKLTDLKDRLGGLGEDARAWATAQGRIAKGKDKGKAEVQTKEGIARRLLISAAEAALTALAAGYARRLVSGASTPHERGHAAVSKKR